MGNLNRGLYILRLMEIESADLGEQSAWCVVAQVKIVADVLRIKMRVVGIELQVVRLAGQRDRRCRVVRVETADIFRGEAVPEIIGKLVTKMVLLAAEETQIK